MKPNENKLLQLLSNHDITFYIPPYQRNYEWDLEQCQVFLDDIIKTVDKNINNDTSEHFFGTITYFQTESVFGQPNKLVLIDGQQRITTTMLFLIALRDLSADKSIKKYIDSTYLKNENISDDNEYKIKLKQVETDWQSYKNIILGVYLDGYDKSTVVYRNYKFFCNKLTKLFYSGYDLTTIIEKGLNKFSVVTIELQPDKNKWENPQEIFESMNSLGKPLSLADLIRNYLLLGINPDEQNILYEKYWLNMERRLPNQLSDFIRDYMQCKNAVSFKKATDKNHKELYGTFKQLFSTKASQDLISEMLDYSVVYSYISLGTKTGNKNIDHRLKDIRQIQTTTAYSFLMAILIEWKQNTLSDNDVVDILDAIIVFILRRRIVGLSSAENKDFPVLIKEIPALIEAENKKEKMFDILSNKEYNFRLPNDIETDSALANMNFYSFNLAKFILSLVEEKITKSRPDENDQNLQLEHIMPQTLNEDWMLELGDNCDEIHVKYINNIGNITLIRHNQELGNKNFQKKKKIYENNSGLQIAKTEIINRVKWNERSIENRKKWVINYILTNIIPIPDNRRKNNNYLKKERNSLSFEDLQLIGEEINLIDDKTIRAKIVNDKQVMFEGSEWYLSPLTKKLRTRNGTANKSGSYQGAVYWEYNGTKLLDLMQNS